MTSANASITLALLRSDNGPEFVARDLRKWLANTGAKTLYIEPGSP
jgi:putative transposase